MTINLKPIALILILPSFSLLAQSQDNALQASPLRVYSPSPFQSTSLSMQLRSAFAPKTLEVFSNLSATSVWAQGNDYQLDYYQNAWQAGAQWQVSERWSSELSYQYAWSGNNHLDNIVKEFHDWFNLSQNGRDDVADHSFNIDSNSNNIHINDFKDETLVSAFTFYNQYQLFQNKQHALSFGASLYYNHVGSGPFERSVFEENIQLNYSYLSGPHALFSSVGVTHKDKDNFLSRDLSARDYTFAVALGYDYHFASNHELLIEYHGYQGQLEDGSDFDKMTHEMNLGYRYTHKAWQWELAATENMINPDNSADISFHGGVRYFFL